MTRHLLFIPAEVVATKLTDAILGDSYAPMAGWYGNSLNPPTADVKRVGIYYERSSFDTLALTLIYDGKTINEACDRLARATGRYDVLPVEWAVFVPKGQG